MVLPARDKPGLESPGRNRGETSTDKKSGLSVGLPSHSPYCLQMWRWCYFSDLEAGRQQAGCQKVLVGMPWQQHQENTGEFICRNTCWKQPWDTCKLTTWEMVQINSTMPSSGAPGEWWKRLTNKAWDEWGELEQVTWRGELGAGNSEEYTIRLMQEGIWAVFTFRMSQCKFHFGQGWANLFHTRPRAQYFWSCASLVSATTTQLYPPCAKQAIDSAWMTGHGCVPIKRYCKVVRVQVGMRWFYCSFLRVLKRQGYSIFSARPCSKATPLFLHL